MRSILALLLGGCAASGHPELRPYDRPPVIRTADGGLESNITHWLESEQECASCGYVRAGSAWYRRSTSLRGFRHPPSPLILSLLRRAGGREFVYEQREASGKILETIEIVGWNDFEELPPGRRDYGCRGDVLVTSDGVSLHVDESRLWARVTR